MCWRSESVYGAVQCTWLSAKQRLRHREIKCLPTSRPCFSINDEPTCALCWNDVGAPIIDLSMRRPAGRSSRDAWQKGKRQLYVMASGCGIRERYYGRKEEKVGHNVDFLLSHARDVGRSIRKVRVQRVMGKFP